MTHLKCLHCLIATTFASLFVVFATPAIASDSVTGQAAFEALGAGEKNEHAGAAQLLIKACPKDFRLIAGMDEVLKEFMTEFALKWGPEDASATEQLINQSAEKMSAGDGCTNVVMAFKGGGIRSVFVELSK